MFKTMRFLRGLLLTVVLFAVGLLLGTVTDPPNRLPDPLNALHPVALTSVEGLWTLLAAVVAHPAPALVALAVACTPLAITTVLAHLPRRINKDPQRLFTTEQRRTISDMVGGRCEMEGVLFTRCRRPGNAGDHWYPHSKGGATDMANLVWACTTCNSRKSNHIPTMWETLRLEWRRRRYFPPGAQTRPGSKYGIYSGYAGR